MNAPTVKEALRRVLDRLPEDAAWEDVMHALCVVYREDGADAPGQRDAAAVDDLPNEGRP